MGAARADDPAFLRGRVDFGGIRKDVSFAYTPDIKPGEYVLVHVGFAIQKVDEDEAQKNLLTLNELLAEFGESIPT